MFVALEKMVLRRRAAARGAVLIALLGATAGARGADAESVWTAEQTSPGIRQAGVAVAQVFQPEAGQIAPFSVARISHVHARRVYTGTARVDTRLCWHAPAERCVALAGDQLDTRAFAGLDARGPLRLVHTVQAWGADRPPLFVRSSVTVWFTISEYR